MGTSNSYDGPPNMSPLLPPWAPDPESPNTNPQQPDINPMDPPLQPSIEPGQNTPLVNSPDQQQTSLQNPPISNNSWSHAKSAMSRVATSGGNRNSIRKAARAYIHAKGGSRGAAKAALSGRKGARIFGSFISTLASSGIRSALESIGLPEVIGQSPEKAVAKIADKLAPSGSYIEDMAAREAIIQALAFFYETHGEGVATIEDLETIDANAAEQIFLKYIKVYISERWLQELGARIEAKAISPEDAVRLERQVKDYIETAIEIDFRDTPVASFQWAQAEAEVANIFQEAYAILEAF